MTIFDGYSFAAQKEAQIEQQVAELKLQGKQLTIAAVLFVEDAGSRLYTRLKREAAERVGIRYIVTEHSVSDQVAQIVATVQQFNADDTVTGIIIQKPRRSIWLAATHQTFPDVTAEQAAYQTWWHNLTAAISAQKDIDGLRPETLAAIEAGTWRQQGMVLPATCKAVLDILSAAGVLPFGSTKPHVLVIGRSDLLGLPLTHELRHLGAQVTNVGAAQLRKLLENEQALRDYDVVVSATGVRKLLRDGSVFKHGVVLIDVGEPSPDIDQTAVAEVAGFITPVPGGVGPVTVVSLLGNAVEL